jgi:hypothetical protein
MGGDGDGTAFIDLKISSIWVYLSGYLYHLNCTGGQGQTGDPMGKSNKKLFIIIALLLEICRGCG